MVSNDPVLQEKAYYNAGNTLFLEGNNAQDLEQQLSNYYDARYQYHQALDRNPGDDQAKKNLRLLEERIKDAEQQKEAQQRRQRTQQGQSPRKHRKRNRNNHQPGMMGQDPDQQSEPGPGENLPEDQQSPGSQQQSPSDSDEDSEDDQPQADSTPNQKNGQLREITPPEEEKRQMPLPRDSTPGLMSEDEALGLLDSLKEEGDKIDLMRRKTDRGVLRDW
ncbi:MAG: hypothetical protein JOZ60_01095 [Verrucomicrobia bacterium]|nr:hypothetical protein [Verrucomicrobiota bacterium]